MFCYKKWLLFAISLATSLIFVSYSNAYTKSETFLIEFETGGYLSLEANKVPLELLLTSLQEKTFFELKARKDVLKQPITVSFQSLAINEAVERILVGLNYSCIFDSNNNLKKIFIMSKSKRGKEDFSEEKDRFIDLYSDKKAESSSVTESIEPINHEITYIPPSTIENQIELQSPPQIEDIVNAMNDHGLMVSTEMIPPEITGFLQEITETPFKADQLTISDNVALQE
jgi:hypothetical protein